ncbi:finger putative transcription factor family-related [Holotrichia oblita]|uniref:Finger putative transcription factor family-related n=1 Tax=Holotrichia oblita TaxID=644536 RepID=A0ACB9TYY3_HOLOL|nr:finger putative transcription factor family-related [Holotrichia oblita]
MPNGRNSTCRTCSQVNSPCLGLFEHRKGEKLLSDILIECTAVKVCTKQSCHIFLKPIELSLEIETESVLSFKDEDFTHVTEEQDISVKHEQFGLLNFDDNESDTLESEFRENYVNSAENPDVVNESSESRYVFDENGVPLSKDGRKLSGRERESVPIFCEHCNRSFCWKYYKVHVKQYLGDRPFKCDLCGKAFVQAFQLRRHRKMHTDERRFPCDICGKTFKHYGNLNLHKGSHTEERSHKCNVCGMGFKQEHRLKAHIKRHDKDKWLVCELCGKSFNDYSSFTRHKGTHAIDKTYPCSICGKILSSPAQKKLHEKKIHSDERPYVCSYCKRGFKHICTLKRHILIHTGEKPYSCNICGKLFRQRECLPAHMRSHTGETPYVCKLCPAKFKLLHLLKKHMHIHSGYS